MKVRKQRKYASRSISQATEQFTQVIQKLRGVAFFTTVEQHLERIRREPHGQQRCAELSVLRNIAEGARKSAVAVEALIVELEKLERELECYRLAPWAVKAVGDRMDKIIDELLGWSQEEREQFAEFIRTSSEYVQDPATSRIYPIRNVTKQ